MSVSPSVPRLRVHEPGDGMQRGGPFPFRAGTGVADITPPLEAGILMSSVERRWMPFECVRVPLHARAVSVASGGRRLVMVSLELLGLADAAVKGMPAFRDRVLRSAGDCVADSDLVMACVHTHSAPETLALSDLPETATYQRWIDELADGVGRAVAQAVASERPCRLSAATVQDSEPGIHRRIKTTQGILLSHPPLPRDIILSEAGATDPEVRVAAFTDESGHYVALLVNATCHPVHEMCIPAISPDYPGALCAELERQFPGACALFFNGAAGNINPPAVSDGPLAADRHGARLARHVRDGLKNAAHMAGDALELCWRPLDLPARSLDGTNAPRTVRTRIAVARIGGAAFVFLPGEPFVETGLAIRAESPFEFTMVCGYSEASIGYIPTDEAFRDGGYETGPGAWSYLSPTSEGLVRRRALGALSEMSSSLPRTVQASE